ncbi:uncharacterized protein LOC111068273 [Drosophila obscura]|uniref:uncharacterized protein LOC111068273 n=1 Tax=Drosophila obscura TaxID=7282 RepID=UPI001BB209C3|nr:uncharacterized protein LOC111068273 [Drosophila obscura]
MPRASGRPLPLTYLHHWKKVLWVSLRCVYFFLLVKCFEKGLQMNVQRRMASRLQQEIGNG